MYLFRRIVFTWQTLLVHVLLLSMITTATALPMMRSSNTQSQTTRDNNGKRVAAGSSRNSAIATTSESPGSDASITRSKRQKVADLGSYEAGPSDDIAKLSKTTGQAWSREQVWIIAVIIKHGKEQVIKNGKEMWIRKAKLDPNANWVVALISVKDKEKPGRWRTGGYQTIRSQDTAGSTFRWTRKSTDSRRPNRVSGAQVRVKSETLILEIGRMTMSQNTKVELATDMSQEIDKDRLDKLPNLLSIYQFLLVLQTQASKNPLIQLHSFDISASSEFGKAFDEMVRARGSGASEKLSEESDKWECALYKRIQSGGAVILEGSLERQNRDILEDLRNQVHSTGLPASSSQNPTLPATSSQSPALPATSPQNPTLPATSSHPLQLPEWAKPENQDVYLDPKWKNPENWKKALAKPSDPPGHHSDI
ncbi:hypothetical protein FB446DRAFT_746435 [Lentinula raphanica]|nr:hypothetical protein FB446DRAFT_746435 [Lentinula raphanica]